MKRILRARAVASPGPSATGDAAPGDAAHARCKVCNLPNALSGDGAAVPSCRAPCLATITTSACAPRALSSRAELGGRHRPDHVACRARPKASRRRPSASRSRLDAPGRARRGSVRRRSAGRLRRPPRALRSRARVPRAARARHPIRIPSPPYALVHARPGRRSIVPST